MARRAPSTDPSVLKQSVGRASARDPKQSSVNRSRGPPTPPPRRRFSSTLGPGLLEPRRGPGPSGCCMHVRTPTPRPTLAARAALPTPTVPPPAPATGLFRRPGALRGGPAQGRERRPRAGRRPTRGGRRREPHSRRALLPHSRAAARPWAVRRPFRPPPSRPAGPRRASPSAPPRPAPAPGPAGPRRGGRRPGPGAGRGARAGAVGPGGGGAAGRARAGGRGAERGEVHRGRGARRRLLPRWCSTAHAPGDKRPAAAEELGWAGGGVGTHRRPGPGRTPGPRPSAGAPPPLRPPPPRSAARGPATGPERREGSRVWRATKSSWTSSCVCLHSPGRSATGPSGAPRRPLPPAAAPDPARDRPTPLPPAPAGVRPTPPLAPPFRAQALLCRAGPRRPPPSAGLIAGSSERREAREEGRGGLADARVVTAPTKPSSSPPRPKLHPKPTQRRGPQGKGAVRSFLLRARPPHKGISARRSSRAPSRTRGRSADPRGWAKT